MPNSDAAERVPLGGVVSRARTSRSPKVSVTSFARKWGGDARGGQPGLSAVARASTCLASTSRTRPGLTAGYSRPVEVLWLPVLAENASHVGRLIRFCLGSVPWPSRFASVEPM
jgi:hypothetical protein